MPKLDNFRRSLVTGALWLSGARMAINLLALLGTLILARLLVPEDFGLAAIAATMLAILTSVTNISLAEALIHHRAPTQVHFETTWTLNLLRGIAVAAVFATISQPVADFYGDQRLVYIMLALSVSAILTGLENPRAIMMTKDLVFWQQFMLQVSQKVVYFFVSVALAIYMQNYWAIIAGIVIGQVFRTALSYTVLPFRPRLRFAHSKELFSFSIWLTLSQVANTINWNMDNLLIGKFVGKADLGFYTVGNNLAIIPTREATTPLTGTLFPAFSAIADQPERLATAYQRSQSIVTAIALPAGVGMALIADPFVRLTMGENWLSAIIVIQILASVFAIQTLGSLSQPLAMACGQTRLIFKRDMQAFAYRVPFIIAGVYFGGLIGILYARAFVGVTSVVFNTNVVTRITGLSFYQQMRPNFRSMAAAASMSLVVYPIGQHLTRNFDHLTNIINLIILTAVGAITYAVVTLALWQAMGRPNGPENELIGILGRLFGMTKRNHQSIS